MAANIELNRYTSMLIKNMINVIKNAISHISTKVIFYKIRKKP